MFKQLSRFIGRKIMTGQGSRQKPGTWASAVPEGQLALCWFVR